MNTVAISIIGTRTFKLSKLKVRTFLPPNLQSWSIIFISLQSSSVFIGFSLGGDGIILNIGPNVTSWLFDKLLQRTIWRQRKVRLRKFLTSAWVDTDTVIILKMVWPKYFYINWKFLNAKKIEKTWICDV